MTEYGQGWASEEFSEVNLGDKRLDTRLIRLCDRFSNAPESPINQACEDWAETKAAYRFFQNESVQVDDILAAHRCKTALRAKAHKTVLALQDTSYFVYTSHPKTEGLGKMSMKKGKNVQKIYSNGLVVHTCLAVTTEGVPLGLLDQNIYSRQLRSEKTGKGVKSYAHLPVEEKESYRWLTALENTKKVVGKTDVVTVCDRDALPPILRPLSGRIKRESAPILLWSMTGFHSQMHTSVNTSYGVLLSSEECFRSVL
jgi:hypothetical protein